MVLFTLTSFFALAMRRRMGSAICGCWAKASRRTATVQAKSVLKVSWWGWQRLFEGIGIRAAAVRLCAAVRAGGRLGQRVHRHFGLLRTRALTCSDGSGRYSSLVPYVNNYYVQAVMMFMIISGGLGFMVWVELCQ
ncbi:MAG: hypothetical protein ACLVJH_15910 [Faecalibacterium prausnitzii]